MQLLDYWLPICNGNNDDTLNQCIENPMQKSFALEREYHNIIGIHCLNLLQVNKVKLYWVQMKDCDCVSNCDSHYHRQDFSSGPVQLNFVHLLPG